MNIDNPIRIGEALRDALIDAPAVAAIIGSRIYPYTTQQEVNLPHVVYDNISVSYADTKDGTYEDTVDVAIHANAGDYPASINLATAIVDALIERESVRVVSVDCEYNDAANLYIHNIIITVTL